jgi:hypothetical protein
MKPNLTHPDWKHRVHVAIGLVFALYFLMLAVTGVMLHHAGDWGLTEKYVSRRYLPSSYRPPDGEETRLDIVVTDLHSGRIFGIAGRWLPDLVAGFWTISILTGIGMVLWRKARRGNGHGSVKPRLEWPEVAAEETEIEEAVHVRD